MTHQRNYFEGVLGAIKQDIIVRDLGGCLITPPMPTPEEWQRDLDRYAPGCGSPIRIAGTNGGHMRCGAWLTHLDGKRTQEFCPHCPTKGHS